MFNVKLALSGSANRDLTPLVRKTLEKFFSQDEASHLGEVTFSGYECKACGDGNKLIKLQPGFSIPSPAKGIPVAVWIEGRQGVRGFLNAEKMDLSGFESRIKIGKAKMVRPQKTKSANPPVLKAKESVLGQSPSDSSLEILEVALPVADTAVALFKDEKRQMTPNEKLLSAGIPEVEIDRLKVTLASIIYGVCGDTDVPNTLQVSVESITKEIINHMKLPHNNAGNYQGTIANFYATRISLFAMKWENSLSPTYRYFDWVFDCLLVLDFIGGKDQLSALSLVRKHEVEVRATEEAIQKQNIPTKNVEEVEQVVLDGFASDAEVLDLVVTVLSGKRQAEEELARAVQNLEALKSAAEVAHQMYMAAMVQVKAAMTHVVTAEAGLKNYELSPDVLDRVRVARRRFDALAQGLGL